MCTVALTLALSGQAPDDKLDQAACRHTSLAVKDAVVKGNGAHRGHAASLLRAGLCTSTVVEEEKELTSTIPLSPLRKPATQDD